MEKTSTLLLNPPLRGHINTGLDNLKVPLGLAYIAAYVRKKGFDNVKILDAKARGDITKINEELWHFGMPYDELKNYIKEHRPKIVGIHCAYTVYEDDVFKAAEIIKSVDKNIYVIVGGAHSSASPESVLKSEHIDMAVRGEGDININI